jgi:hypothetical protein
MCRLTGRFRCLLPSALSLVVVACGGNSTSPPPPPVSTENLYVTETTVTIPPFHPVIFEFSLPLTSASTPKVVLNPATFSPGAEDVNGNFASGNAFTVVAFTGPLTASPTPFVSISIPTGNVGFLAFDAAGDLFVPDSNSRVYMVPHPLTSTSQPTQQITSPSLTLAQSVALDSNNNLIVLNLGASPSLVAFAPPYTSAPAVAPLNSLYGGNIVVIGNQLFLMRRTSLAIALNQQIDVFNLPVTASSQPAFSIGGLSDAINLATDQEGNLYVADNFTNVLVYRPPFSASSSPSVTLNVKAMPQTPATYSPVGVLVGK